MLSLNEPARPLRLLIVEDHPLLRLGLRMELECDQLVVYEATSGAEAVLADVAFAPDVILMDISMPVMNGIQAVQEIRKANLSVKIIAFTSHNTPEHLQAALSAGVNGYCLKETPKEDVLAGIEAVLRGETWLKCSGQSEQLHA